MEKLSRVEKYKQLRESVDQNTVSTKPTIEPVELQKHLLDIESKDSAQEEENKHSHKPLRFSKEIDVNRTYDTGKETFHNEYLDDFLNEVKEYNLEKGTRLSDNTQIDILLHLDPENRRRRTQHYDSIRDETFEQKEKEEDADVAYTESLSHEELQAEMDKLFNEDEKLEENEKKDHMESNVQVETYASLLQETPLKRINPVTPLSKKEAVPETEEEPAEEAKNTEETKILETKDFVEEEKKEDLPNLDDTFVNEERLIAETSQIRMQMDDYEDELNDLHAKVSKSNRILNVILLVLIIALIAVIAVTIYWLKEAGGFF